MGEAGTLQCCQKDIQLTLRFVADTSDLHIQGQGGVITGWITIKSSKTYHDGTRRSMIHAGGGAVSCERYRKDGKSYRRGCKNWSATGLLQKSYPGFLPGTNMINCSSNRRGKACCVYCR